MTPDAYELHSHSSTLWGRSLNRKGETTVMNRNTDSEDVLRALILQTPRLQQPVDPLKVVIFGRDRTGKSALVNSLLGQQFAEERGPPSSRCNVRSYGRTLDIQLSVVIFDTPSIGAIDRRTEDILDEVATKTKGSVDVVVFCIDMRGRLNDGDVDCMSQIAQKYGKSVWERGVVALTFGNKFVQSQDNSGADDYEEKWTELKNTIRSLFHQKVGLPVEVANSIPVLPMGYKKSPFPHDKENWRIRFWISALNIIRNVDSRAILIAENSNTILLTTLRSAVVTGYNRIRGVMNWKALAGGSIVVMLMIILILYRYSHNLGGTVSVSMLVDHTESHASGAAMAAPLFGPNFLFSTNWLLVPALFLFSTNWLLVPALF